MKIKYTSNIVTDEEGKSSDIFDFIADDSLSKSLVRCGCIEIAGRRIYIGSSFPSDARNDDILIKI